MANRSVKFTTSGAALMAAFAAGEASAQVPAYNWTGFYVGAHAGYGWGRTKTDGDDVKLKGALGGLQAGYNWNLSSVVVGAEVDTSLSGIDGSDEIFSGKQLTEHQRWAGTARLRVGLPVNGVPLVNNVLLYGTGGLAWSQWRGKFDDILGVSKDRIFDLGWTAGGGAELALSNAVSLKLEYLYADFGKKKYDFGETVDHRLNTLRVGINFRFNAPPP
jgi:outer membrane immunogenic protein